MGIKKIVESLTAYLDEGQRKKRMDCDQIVVLLGKLEDKEKKLKKKLDKENNPAKRKKLKTEIKIVSVQRRKGEERAKELMKAKCK